MGALERFRAIHGFEVLEIEERGRSEPSRVQEFYSTLIWCCLPAGDREEITRHQVRDHLTLPRLIKMLRQMQTPTTDNN